MNNSKNISVELIRAKNLPKTDLLSDSDPYAIVTWENKKFKSKVIKDDLSPVWNQAFEINLCKSIEVAVWDKNRIGKDDFLGKSQLDLFRMSFSQGKTQKITLPLYDSNGHSGTVFLEMTPLNFSQTNNDMGKENLLSIPAKSLTTKYLKKINEESDPTGNIICSEIDEVAFESKGDWHNSNWIPSIEQEPLAIFDVTSLNDCVHVIKKAEKKGLKVRAVGSGHSYSDVLHAPDFLITTHSLNKVLRKPHIYNKEWQVEVEGGMRLHYLIKKVLKPAGLALANLGGYDGQTIAGVVSTGTHGSGIDIGPIANVIRSVVLVTKGGQVQRIEPEDGPSDPNIPETLEGHPVKLIKDNDYFNSVTISWGCFGIIYSVRLGLLKEYWLHETREIAWWSQLKPEINKLNSEHRHVEILVNPYPEEKGEHKGDHICLLTIRDIVKHDPSSSFTMGGRNFFAQLSGQIPLAVKSLVGLLNSQPQITPWIVKKSIKGLVHEGYTQRYDKVLLLGMNATATIGCATELIYPIEGDHYINAVEEMFSQLKITSKYEQYLSCPLSLRFIKQSEQPLSMSYGQDVCAVEIMSLSGIKGYKEVMFRATQNAYKHKGKPHWGLNFGKLNLPALDELYPKFNTWKKYYDENNAKGTFSNALTSRLGLDPV